MRLLLDTHVLIWLWAEGRELPRSMKTLLIDPANDIAVSAASAWEMATKLRLGKLPRVDAAVRNFAAWVERDQMSLLAIDHDHALRAGGFISAHGDPFDRILAAQSIIEQRPIVSIDTALDPFGCERIWE